MGSSSKSGGGTTRHYYASIPAIVGWGPLYGIGAILLNGERVWSGSLRRSSTTNPVNITTKYGQIRFYWGTEDQPADPLLGGRRYKGLAYLVFVDFDHGQATNAYNTEVILLGGAPQQSIVTGAAAEPSYGNGIAVNPIALTAEILTAPYWRGLPAEALDVESFRSLADAVPRTTAISPLYNDAADLRSVLVAATGMVDGWLRRTPAGKIQAGRWNDAAATDVTVLTHDDFTETPKTLPSKNDDVPNSYAVEFVDRTALHKEAKIVVNDDAALAVPGAVLNRKTLSAPHLLSYDQAQLAGREALRRAAKLATWSGSIRIGKARTPAGARIQPGDYLRVPLSQPKEATQLSQLVRVLKVRWPRDATAAVQVEADLAPVSSPVLAMGVAAEPVDPTPASVPPINHARVFALPSPSAGVQPPIHIVAARPCDTALGFDIHFDTELDGDFPAIARSTGYALPMHLVEAVTAAATTLRLSMLAAGAYSQSYQRDSSLLRNWTGGATQGRNDDLLVLLFALDGGGQIVAQEVCSVAGTPTLVAADTFDVPVFRGRLGTSALAHATTVEVWVVHSTSLAAIEHADIMAAASSGSALYFQPGAYTLRETYAPAEAWTERNRRATAEEALAEYAAQPDASTWVPTLTLVIPAGYRPPADDELPPGDLMDLLGGTGGLRHGAGAIQWRYKELDCSLGGIASNDGSAPTRRWLTRSGSGTMTSTGFNTGSPDWLTCSWSYTLSGAQHYDAATLVCTGQIHRSCTGSGPGIGVGGGCLSSPLTPAETNCGCGSPNYCGTLGDIHVDTVTTLTCTSSDANTTGSHVITLSDEDNDWNARLRAEAGVSWTDWSSTAVAAAYEQRTAGITYHLVVEEYRGSWIGYQPGWFYRIEIPTEIQPYGNTAADWVDSDTISVTLVADSDGAFSIDPTELTCPIGYRRRPKSVIGPTALEEDVE